MRGGLSMIDRMRQVGLVTLLAAGLLVTNTPAIGVVPAGAGSCLSEAGPVGETFEDCSGGQVFNLVPPGQAALHPSLLQRGVCPRARPPRRGGRPAARAVHRDWTSMPRYRTASSL